ncbi:MAG: patatin-like phospholipase family protein [Myxococcales bacterium]|nr:patatin-like phospholipase family protein [Myxococcales bacterium]
MPKTGLVLAGGGARGAYEVGVLYYLFVDGPPELREMARFNVLCGTSIGALNIAATAASIHQPSVGIRRLADLWRTLSIDRVLQIGLTDIMSLPAWLVGRNSRESVFPGEPVRAIIEEDIDWGRIHVNLAQGLLDAVSLSCTQVPTGKTVVFYETSDGRPRKFSRDPHVRPVLTRLTPAHCRASSAIPFVFPAVPIDSIPYVDGGLRQNTPLSPALRLGSQRLMVVGLGHEKALDDDAVLGDWKRRLASPIFLLAKVLNALMLDHVDYDLIRLEHINQVLRDGESVFGREFPVRMNSMFANSRGAAYRIIPTIVLRPSKDLGKLAADHVRSGGLQSDRRMTSRVIRTIARLESKDEADLTSYVLFDGAYCSKLIELGIHDAQRRRDDLLRFFAEAQQPTQGPAPVEP